MKGALPMAETILRTNTLPEPLFHLIKTESVKVNEANGIISLIPITDGKVGCPLRGLCADGKLSSYDFMANKQAEKDLEG
jgi:hypothetical protein